MICVPVCSQKSKSECQSPLSWCNGFTAWHSSVLVANQRTYLREYLGSNVAGPGRFEAKIWTSCTHLQLSYKLVVSTMSRNNCYPLMNPYFTISSSSTPSYSLALCDAIFKFRCCNMLLLYYYSTMQVAWQLPGILYDPLTQSTAHALWLTIIMAGFHLANGNRYIVTISDYYIAIYFTKCAWAKALPTKEASNVVNALDEVRFSNLYLSFFCVCSCFSSLDFLQFFK